MEQQAEISPEGIQAWAKMVRVSQQVIAQVEADLKAAGHPPLSWYDALLELKRAGAAGLRPFELQKEMLLAQYNISRLVDRLVKADLVNRSPAPEDGRGAVLSLSPAGAALLERMWPDYRQAIFDNFLSALSPEDTAALSAALDKLRR